MIYRITNYKVNSEGFLDVVDDILNHKIVLRFLRPESLKSTLLQLGDRGQLIRQRYPKSDEKEGLIFTFGVDGRNGGFCCTEEKEMRLIIERFYRGHYET